jgi:aspartyl-tRNA synthetase
MPIQDLRELFRESSFRVFKEIVASGGTVRGFVIQKASHYSRSEVDGIVDMAKQQLGATGLVWARRSDDGAVTSSVMKAMGEDAVRRMLDETSTGNGGLIFVAAGEPDATSKLLGQLRLILAKKDGLLKPDEFAFTWVVDFPLLEWDPEANRYNSMHHPFTSAARSEAGAFEFTTRRCRAGSSRCSTSALRRQSSVSGSSSRRLNTGRRLTEALPWDSTASPRSSPTKDRSAKSSPSRRPRRPWT